HIRNTPYTKSKQSRQGLKVTHEDSNLCIWSNSSNLGKYVVNMDLVCLSEQKGFDGISEYPLDQDSFASNNSSSNKAVSTGMSITSPCNSGLAYSSQNFTEESNKAPSENYNHCSSLVTPPNNSREVRNVPEELVVNFVELEATKKKLEASELSLRLLMDMM
ncbi:hypothetical protein BB560_004506, partial [Smittium megazygosporum]